jgi:hypothetical protein
MFCKHKWVKVTETTTESKMEQASKMELQVKATGDGMFEMFNKKYICILQCGNCGKLKRFVEGI